MTLIEVRVGGRLVGRCDARCYGAQHGGCHCVCRGRNHGKGLEAARAGMAEAAYQAGIWTPEHVKDKTQMTVKLAQGEGLFDGIG